MTASADNKKVADYLDTVAKLEPDIHPVDTNAALTSIAISLKRIADVLVYFTEYQFNRDAGR